MHDLSIHRHPLQREQHTPFTDLVIRAAFGFVSFAFFLRVSLIRGELDELGFCRFQINLLSRACSLRFCCLLCHLCCLIIIVGGWSILGLITIGVGRANSMSVGSAFQHQFRTHLPVKSV